MQKPTMHAARNKGIICEPFFRTGHCSIPDCPFTHVKPGEERPVPDQVCAFFHVKGCLRQQCRYFHGTVEQLAELKAQQKTTYRPEDYMQKRDPRNLTKEDIQTHLEEQLWAATTKFVPPSTLPPPPPPPPPPPIPPSTAARPAMMPMLWPQPLHSQPVMMPTVPQYTVLVPIQQAQQPVDFVRLPMMSSQLAGAQPIAFAMRQPMPIPSQALPSPTAFGDPTVLTIA
jgi:hypothetical protein